MVTTTTSLALSRLTCQVPNYKSEILALNNTKINEPLYTEFLQQFLIYIPIDYRFKDRSELFGKFAYDAFEFFKNRVPTERKSAITTTIIEGNPAINILVLGNNKPFIVDSLSCLLANLGLQAKFLLHPVIRSIRDRAGKLQSIEASNNGAGAESLVHITILGNFNTEAITALEVAINNTLNQVDTTYNVWQNLLDRVTSITDNIISTAPNNLNYNEAIEFLNWLKDNNFTFLGIADFDLVSEQLSLEEGVVSIWQEVKEIKDIIKCSASVLYQDQLLILGKINKISPVHKNNLVDYILIKKIGKDGHYNSGTIIFGLYSSAIYYQSISNIPILRQKLQFVLDKAGFSSHGYNSKELKIIIESLPREALIQIDQGDLYCMCLHMLSSMMSRKLKLFIQQDWSSSFINIIIFLTRERLTPEIHTAIDSYLSEKFGNKILSNYITEVAANFSYLFVTIEVQDKNKMNFAVEIMEQELDQLSTRWSEDFYHKLSKKFGEYQAGLLFKVFDPIFSVDYRQKFDAETALIDIEFLKQASEQNKTLFSLILLPQSSGEFQLKIYNPLIKLSLSNILPSIENLGFKAIDEQSFMIKEANGIKESWIHQFTLTSLITIEKPSDLLKTNVEQALDKISQGLLANDSLSKLIVLAGFNWREVKLVKALTRYLHQTGFTYGKGYVQLTLIKHCEYTRMLVDLFDARFNPENILKDRIQTIQYSITNYLNTINSSSEDKVLRTMFEVIEAIVRTNYYQLSKADNKEIYKNYISFKFDSHKVVGLPLPVPYAEIFVYANEFEAIHLRGGKVARGGIRWSDRGEDYRTEVLGLMKAQMTKNSVIVPVGSKGGFFLNFTAENLLHTEYMEKVVESYKNFLRGLLDITDNIVDSKIIHPQNTIIYDEEDPYLVVAADKGTATFSDYANSVSAEYNFWLGDAFASGGSAGYDHKKMAITSKGAWISVASHFSSMGIDVQKDPIRTVGIGDMSGDVFGNGMLRSNTILLIAAFNHKHIFIDPTPDAVISFNERNRLFNLPMSSWSDYTKELISPGGGIFERSSKTIILSPQIKELLNINNDELLPEELIRAILQADVDLLWNGGIGTYIKATTESHLEIGDKANDSLRCDAKNIKAKVIGEGGNIGVSQLGRIEYSKKGGRINTDFIDNSGGVDCSDHEVNIKIALNLALKNGKLTLEERNKLLFSMTRQVEELVLIDNYQQNQAITIMQSSLALSIGMFSQLIDGLEEEKLLDRAVEFLPTSEELVRRSLSNEPMTRPELAVLLSYSKRSTYQALANSTFSHDKYFESYLINYFPRLMQEKFSDEILNHPLKHEIIRTVVTNKIINQLGGALLYALKRETGVALCDIIRSYTIISEIFDLDNLWLEVESATDNIDYNTKIEMFTSLTKLIRRGISWLVKHIEHPINITQTIEEFIEPAQYLSKVIGGLLVGDAMTKFNDKVLQYISAGVDATLATKLSTLDISVSVFDIIYISKQTNIKNIEVAKLYFAAANKFSLDWLRKACDKQLDDSYWNRLSVQSLKEDLYEKQRKLLIVIINQTSDLTELDLWINNNKQAANIFLEFIKLIKTQENMDLSILILANKKFEIFLHRLK